MKKQIKASKLNFDFFDWYNNILTDSQQAAVDECADELGCPEYIDCDESDLSRIFYRWAKTRYNSNELSRKAMQRELVEASEDFYEDADLYVVKIWHEVEADPESMYLPEAAEEIFEIVANSPQAAIEIAKMRWSGPIDRIEIVDVNPDDSEDEEIPFYASTDVTAATDTIKPDGTIQVGMYWVRDWHDFTVDSIAPNHKTCKITEEWISEDTGKEMKQTRTYKIVNDNDVEFVYDPQYESYLSDEDYAPLFKMYADGANNYPIDWDAAQKRLDEKYAEARERNNGENSKWSPDTDPEYESQDEELMPRYNDDYTPSATAGDYSPSNPWDAPGMSMSDFI